MSARPTSPEIAVVPIVDPSRAGSSAAQCKKLEQAALGFDLRHPAKRLAYELNTASVQLEAKLAGSEYRLLSDHARGELDGLAAALEQWAVHAQALAAPPRQLPRWRSLLRSLRRR